MSYFAARLCSTAVDRWLGIRRPADDPTVGLLFASSQDTTRRVAIRPLFRGALIQAGPSAMWSVRARIDLTRLLVQRTIGAAVTLDHPGAAWWFDEGVAHGIALQVLLDVGVVDLEEAAIEVSSWLAEETLSAQSGASLEQLVSVATSGRPKALAAARRQLATRGALLAMALNGASGNGLQRAARQLLERGPAPASVGHSVQRADAFFAAASGQPGAAGSEALRAAFQSGRPIPVRAADLSPCLVMVKRRVHAFDLGFATRATARGDVRVVSVDPSGPAARAGVREGDTIVSLDHVEGRSDVLAKVDLGRDDRTVRASYLPRGTSRSTRALAVASRRGGCALDG